MTQEQQEKLLEDLFRAYFEARKNKRGTANAVIFELDHEDKLIELFHELLNREYQLSPSICFINHHPIKREIFAAGFRDRIVHHLVFNYINHIFERVFINDSYSCRQGRGTGYGIKRLDHFIRSCSDNYHRDCYILKMDIQGYFMNLNKDILFAKLTRVLRRYEHLLDVPWDFLFYLLRILVFHNPVENCRIRGKVRDWKDLPRDKSLFYTPRGKGLPIGNLTSQLFGNVYLDDMDHYIKYGLGCRYYGRYVDDLVVVSRDKEFLKQVKSKVDRYLWENLGLNLHPRKVYLQHFSKGVGFLGVYIKPYRKYMGARTKRNFKRKIRSWNRHLTARQIHLEPEEALHLESSINSYLGIMKHYNTKVLRKRAVTFLLDVRFFNWFYLDPRRGILQRR